MRTIASAFFAFLSVCVLAMHNIVIGNPKKELFILTRESLENFEAHERNLLKIRAMQIEREMMNSKGVPNGRQGV